MTEIQQIPGWYPGQPIRVLPYGAPKVGKTFGAGTFPRPCFMDFDRGINTVFSPDFLKLHGYRPVVYKEFYERSFKGPIVSAHNAYDDACQFFDEMMSPAKRNTFDTWVIDSGTTLSEDAQNKAVILLGTKDYGFMSKTHEQAMKYRLLVPKIQDYGAERSLVEQFVDMILSTEKHVVFICHEYEKTDDQGNVVGVEPLLTGKSRQVVPLKFGEVYWLRSRRKGTEWETVCTTKHDGFHVAGSRNSITDQIPWTYDAVKKALEDSYNERVKQITAAQAASDKALTPKAADTPQAVKTA